MLEIYREGLREAPRIGGIASHMKPPGPDLNRVPVLPPERLAPVVFEPLRCILEPDNDPLAQGCQCGLNPLGLCVVLWVKHSADNGFADAKPFG